MSEAKVISRIDHELRTAQEEQRLALGAVLLSLSEVVATIRDIRERVGVLEKDVAELKGGRH